MARNRQEERGEEKSTVTLIALQSVSIGGVFIAEGKTGEIDKGVFETLEKEKNPILKLVKLK